MPRMVCVLVLALSVLGLHAPDAVAQIGCCLDNQMCVNIFTEPGAADCVMFQPGGICVGDECQFGLPPPPIPALSKQAWVVFLSLVVAAIFVIRQRRSRTMSS